MIRNHHVCSDVKFGNGALHEWEIAARLTEEGDHKYIRE